MSSTPQRRGVRAVIAAAGLGLVAAPLTLVPSAAFAADVDITLLNINDFHGRIDGNTVAFAATVEDLRADNPNTLFLSAGDNIGASLFASATADDKPTIDVLNALDLKASAVGNHEFDKGYDDLNGRVSDLATFPYLGANVYEKGTDTPALDEYEVFTVGGLTVGVIGAVTQEAPTLVSPGGVANLEFGDPVEAVNRVAAQLSDGDDANGEADVIVAEYHEGASEGGEATLEQNVDNGGAFADIVTKTSNDVDAIFTGHTHMQYAYNDALKPNGETRPIVQTGSYGENIGTITLTVDDATGAVTEHTAANVARQAPVDADGDGEIGDAEQATFDDALAAQVAADPVLQNVKKIVDDAIAAAEEVGKRPVGAVSDDITTAFAEGHFENGVWVGPGPTATDGRDDRGSESTLGNLVANALRDTLSTPELGGAQIGVVNPGGLRNELIYASTGNPDTDKDGVITYAEANAVLPFVNNLWTVTVTGAQFKQILEEQWQPADSSRPFLALGLSDNVSTVLDESAKAGHHVVSVRVDGKPLRMKQNYVIGTFNFLAQGGDNFSTFAEAPFKDSGLVDREAWIDYLGNHEPVAPSFDRRQVYADGMPATIRSGRKVSFSLDKLNLTSLGSPQNTRLVARLAHPSGKGKTRRLDTFPITDGHANVSMRVNAPAKGTWVVELVARPSGTTVTIPVVNRRPRPHMRVMVRPGELHAGVTMPRVRVSLRTPGHAVHGKVRVRTHRDVQVLRIRDGHVIARFTPYAEAGRRRVSVTYLGSPQNRRMHEVVRVRVKR